MKHKIDEVNKKNQEWQQSEQGEECSAGESKEMEELLGVAPGLCGCEECVSPDDVQDEVTQPEPSQRKSRKVKTAWEWYKVKEPTRGEVVKLTQ